MSSVISARSSALALAALLAAVPAAAQLCTGMPFERGPVQLFGRAARVQGDQRLGAGVALGVPAVFAQIGVARTSAWNLDRSGAEVRAALGWAYPGGPQQLLRTCLVGSLAIAAGPYDVIVADASGTPRRMDLSGWEWSVGVSAGSARSITKIPFVFPTGAAWIVGATRHTRDRATQAMTGRAHVHGILEAGVGVQMGGMFLLRPMITVPVGLASADYGASLTFSTALGRRTRTARDARY